MTTEEWAAMIARIEDAEREMRRDELRRCAELGLAKALAAGNHNVQRVLEIALAALDYGDSVHVRNSNCAAGDHDQCSADEALEKLEALIGGPRSVDE